MEDVIEERAITKLCGYVLCSKPLTTVTKQRYHISTHRNKVYDISRRKNFCSSTCYGTSNYLLGQMLESPLWLRDKEDIPVFKILPINPKSTQSTLGDEIDIVGTRFMLNKDDEGEATELNTTNDKQAEHQNSNINVVCNNNSSKVLQFLPDGKNNISNDTNERLQARSNEEGKKSDNGKTQLTESPQSQLDDMNKNKDTDDEKVMELNLAINNKYVEYKNSSINIVCNDSKVLQHQLYELNDNHNDTSERLQFQPNEEGNKTDDSKTHFTESPQSQLDELNKTYQSQLNEFSSSNTPSSTFNVEHRERTDVDGKNKRYKQKKSDDAEEQVDVCSKIISHIEQSVREWITEKTLQLLQGEVNEKVQLLQNLALQDKYQKWCNKFNALQLQDEEKDYDLKKNVRKPLPYMSVLQEEGKKMELKV